MRPAVIEMRTQAEKGRIFREMHERPGVFVIPNPWDAGSAKMLAALGYQALATTSFGCAGMLGYADGAIPREEVIENCRRIAEATDLPVSADLENCYAHEPEEAAQTIRLAAQAGMVGGSIEDATKDPAKPIYDFDFALERVAAAAKAARALAFPFTLVARAENLLHGRPDLEDTLRRLRAYGEAGADVLYAPGLRDLATIKRVVAELPKPVNVLISMADPSITVKQLGEAGVRRVSVGGSLWRLALSAARKAALVLRDEGSFRAGPDMLSAKDVKQFLKQ